MIRKNFWICLPATIQEPLSRGFQNTLYFSQNDNFSTCGGCPKFGNFQICFLYGRISIKSIMLQPLVPVECFIFHVESFRTILFLFRVSLMHWSHGNMLGSMVERKNIVGIVEPSFEFALRLKYACVQSGQKVGNIVTLNYL